jgi:hypothetical protein
VEPEHQADFAELLSFVYASGPGQQQLYQQAVWAASLAEPGSVWEERLDPLLRVLPLCQEYQRAVKAALALGST